MTTPTEQLVNEENADAEAFNRVLSEIMVKRRGIFRPSLQATDLTRLLNALLEFERSYVRLILSGGPFGAVECRKWGPIVIELLSKCFALRHDSNIGKDAPTTVTTMIQRLLADPELTRDRLETPWMSFTEFDRVILRGQLLHALGIPQNEWPDRWSVSDANLTAQNIQLKSNFPPEVFEESKLPFLTIANRISKEPSIALFCDLRGSQNMMLYSSSPGAFDTHMRNFIVAARMLTFEHAGVFDKFTGDGFLVYFSPVVMGEVQQVRELRKHGQSALRDPSPTEICHTFSVYVGRLLSLIGENLKGWTAGLSAVPKGGIGFGVGADYGVIRYDWTEGMMISIGLPIVLANRMCSAAETNEVILGHPLHMLLERNGQLVAEPKEVRLKNGDSLQGWNYKSWESSPHAIE